MSRMTIEWIVIKINNATMQVPWVMNERKKVEKMRTTDVASD